MESGILLTAQESCSKTIKKEEVMAVMLIKAGKILLNQEQWLQAAITLMESGILLTAQESCSKTIKKEEVMAVMLIKAGKILLKSADFLNILA